MQLTVATIARPHGLRGEVALTVRTDEPGERLAVGTVLATAPAQAGPLTVVGTRVSGDRWYARFAEIDNREAAEGLRGVDLLVDSGSSTEDDAWYPHELVGLRAELSDGTVVGEVVGLEHLPAQDVLVIREPDGRRSLVPFVSAIVPEVDVVGGRLVLDPPRGLLAADAAAAEVADGSADEGAAPPGEGA